MSKTYIQEVLMSRSSDEEIIRVESLPNGMWHVKTSAGCYIIKPDASVYLSDHLQLDETVSWIDTETANIRVARGGFHYVAWSDFIAFVQDGHLTAVLEEYTEQLLSETWKEFQDLRALDIRYYTPQGVVSDAIDASCAAPWSQIDYTKPMPSPDGNNCVAFCGHGHLGWPKSFLRKYFEFGKGKNKEGFPQQ